MSKLTLTRGVPGSGKSTWAKLWVDEDPENRARINRDDYRLMLFNEGGVLDNKQEQAVTKAQHGAAKALLDAGISVIVDDTNLNARFVKEWYKIHPEIDFIDFPVLHATAVRQDQMRARTVGVDVITRFFDRYVVGGRGGTQLKPVPDNPSVGVFEPYSHTPGLPWAILVDVDGTLAHMGDRRGPYETDKYHLDKVDDAVRSIVAQAWNNSTVIIFTARRAAALQATSDWLAANNIKYDDIYTRDDGDDRNDAIVKNEMFEKHIAGKFNVRFILDDRDRVVDMWRTKGLKTLQVAPGNF